MKKLTLSIVSILAIYSVSYAGPNVKSLTDYDAQDLEKAEAVVKKKSKPTVEKKIERPKKIPISKETISDTVGFTKDKSVIKKPKIGEEKSDLTTSGFEKSVKKHKKSSYHPVFYLGIALSAIGSDSDGRATIFTNRTTQDRQIGFMAKFGYNVFEYLSTEIRGTYGIVNEADGTKFKNLAIYLRPKYNFNEDLLLYALAGYGNSNLQGENVDKNGFSYGFGVKYMTFENVGVCLDAVNYLSKADSNSMWGLNLVVEVEF